MEELKRYGKHKRDKLKERVPPYVEKMMRDHDLIEEYQALVNDLAEAGVGRKLEDWNLKKLNEIAKAWEYKFNTKGIKVYVSHKEEYISHGAYGGHMEYFRWLEFVDMTEQPNYVPQRDADTKPKEECVVS